MIAHYCPACRHNSLYYTPDHIRCSNCNAYDRPLTWPIRVLVWTRDKTWWWRALILLWLGYIFYKYLSNYEYPMNRIANIFNAIDFGVHELGHILFIPFGQFMTILGGSLFQILFPVFWMIALARQKWYFAASACFIWLGFNLYDVATYVADARVRLLPLATLATDYDSAHDWYQILSRLGKLESDKSIAMTMRVFGASFAVIGFILCITLLACMLFKPFKKEPEDLDTPAAAPMKPGEPAKIYPDAPPAHTAADFEPKPKPPIDA